MTPSQCLHSLFTFTVVAGLAYAETVPLVLADPVIIPPQAEKISKPPTQEFASSEVAVILAHGQFYPSRLKLKAGTRTRLFFTTVSGKPAALVIEKLGVQKWVNKDSSRGLASEGERTQFETNREVINSRITEVILDPKPGTYGFHDALTGASGEIIVEAAQ